MKDNTYTSARAKCPYYAYQSVQCIYCRARSGHVARQGFASVEMKKEHQKKYCYRDWKSCFWAKAITEIIERES